MFPGRWEDLKHVPSQRIIVCNSLLEHHSLNLAAEWTAIIIIASFSYRERHNKRVMTLKSMPTSYTKEAFGQTLPSVRCKL